MATGPKVRRLGELVRDWVELGHIECSPSKGYRSPVHSGGVSKCSFLLASAPSITLALMIRTPPRQTRPVKVPALRLPRNGRHRSSPPAYTNSPAAPTSAGS